MTTRIVLATNNAKKLNELRRVVHAAGIDVEVAGLADFPAYPDPAETGRTFEENALIKARTAAERTGVPAVADDSGIEVDELNDMPGVRSARWAGPACDDEANLQLLLDQLDGVPAERRGARFVCALAWVTPQGEERLWRGVMPGRVAERRAGERGFGYDPIFVAHGHDVTTAELTHDEKDAISHRGQAVRSFVSWLKEQK